MSIINKWRKYIDAFVVLFCVIINFKHDNLGIKGKHKQKFKNMLGKFEEEIKQEEDIENAN